MNHRLIALGALLVSFLALGPCQAQAPVQPYYGVTSTTGAKGFQPVDATHGLPVGAQAVATCGTKALTAGIIYPITQDLTGTICTAGGGGGGGAVTIADGADVTQGTIADAASTAGGAGTISAKLRLMTTQLGTINTTLGSPLQAGGTVTANLGTLNGAATAANQTTMATNQTGGGQKTQIVDGSGNVISATANALDINIKSGSATVAASENHIGEVGGNILPITNAMTTSNATVTTGQSIGGIQTLANAVRVSGALGASGTSGIIQSVVITFLDAVATSQIDVYFYNATVTTGSNCQNATTFVLQTADRTNVLGIAKVTDFTSSNTAVVAQANNLAIPFGLASGTSLFACLVARGSFVITGTANASLKVNVLRN